MEEVIAKIIAVRNELETLTIPATDHNTITVYGSRQILQGVVNDLTELLNTQRKTSQAEQAGPDVVKE